MKRWIRTLLMLSLACAITSCAHRTAPTAKPPRDARAAAVRVVSIRYVTGAGLCSCYCGSEIQVVPGHVTLFKRPFRDCQRQNPEKYRELKVDADLSYRNWLALEALVPHDALFGLPERIGCPGCTDGPTNLVEVNFSDGTKKSVFYESAPPEIAALSERLLALTEKLERELPPSSPIE